jgi:hypothetical protein
LRKARRAKGKSLDDGGCLRRVIDPDETRRLLASLAADPEVAAVRVATCETIARALQALRHTCGTPGSSSARTEPTAPRRSASAATPSSVSRPSRRSAASGAATLLAAGNRYAAAALTRQVVEVEHLAWAFAEGDKAAMEWLHADREARRKFWNPDAVRKRANGRFLASDYWGHCGRGGHPTREGPDHKPRMDAPMFWAELGNTPGPRLAGSRGLPHGSPTTCPRIGSTAASNTMERWTAADRMAAALRDVSAQLKDPKSKSQPQPGR